MNIILKGIINNMKADPVRNQIWGDFILVKDNEGRCIEISNSFLELMKLRKSDIIGKCLEELILEDLPLNSLIEKIAMLNPDGIKKLVIVKTGNDVNKYISVVNSVLKGYKNETLGTMIEGRDISELKYKEIALRLEQKKTEDAKNVQSKFLANMSHEIRTPMNGILGMIDLTLLTRLEEEQRENLVAAKDSAKALMRIIDDILNYTRLESNQYSIVVEKTNIYDLINNLYELFFIQIKQRNLQFQIIMDPSIPRNLICDSARLRQVISNLLGNAIKFTKEGEVVLMVELMKKTEKNVTVKFSVSDTGIGISELDSDKIFKGFMQADDSLSKEFGGTGLGLSISKALVHLMGGELEFQSQLGEGSNFYFTLCMEYGAEKEIEDEIVGNRYLPFRK